MAGVGARGAANGLVGVVAGVVQVLQDGKSGESKAIILKSMSISEDCWREIDNNCNCECRRDSMSDEIGDGGLGFYFL